MPRMDSCQVSFYRGPAEISRTSHLAWKYLFHLHWCSPECRWLAKYSSNGELQSAPISFCVIPKVTRIQLHLLA